MYAPGLVIRNCFSRVEDFSKFFGPSPRKHRLTVYRGLQVCMISILTKGRDIPRDGCGGHPGGAQCGSKNLLQRGILCRHEKILLRQGRLQTQTQKNNIYEHRVVFMNIFGLINSFGLSLFVGLESVILLHLIAAGSPRKSIRERLKQTKVSRMMLI